MDNVKEKVKGRERGLRERERIKGEREGAKRIERKRDNK